MKNLSRYQIQEMVADTFKKCEADPGLIKSVKEAKEGFEKAAFATGKNRAKLLSTGLGGITVAIVTYAPTASPVVTALLRQLEGFYHQAKAA